MGDNDIEIIIFRTNPMKPFLETAFDAARTAGDLLMNFFEKPKDVEYKGEVDLVTDIDRRSEAIIVSHILAQYPRHAIFAEEGTRTQSKSDYRWIIDPLDGTTNYTHHYPCFAVSIALERQGEIILGVVYDPVRPELYWAERGGGAYLNGKKISVSKEKTLSRSLLVTGFPVHHRKHAEENLRLFHAFTMVCHGVRRDGSAALDLCYLAAGRFDGFWELRLHAWDTAAGSLIVQEAGGRISDFKGNSFDPFGIETLASNGSIHDPMMAVLREAYPPSS